MLKQAWAQRETMLQFRSIFTQTIFVLLKGYESTEVDVELGYMCPRGLTGPPAVTLIKCLKYKKRIPLRCIYHFKSDLINNMDHNNVYHFKSDLINNMDHNYARCGFLSTSTSHDFSILSCISFHGIISVNCLLLRIWSINVKKTQEVNQIYQQKKNWQKYVRLG